MNVTPEEQFRTLIHQIDERIIELGTLRAQTIENATANVDPAVMSDRLSSELGRPYDSEILYVKRKRNLASIAFAETFLQ